MSIKTYKLDVTGQRFGRLVAIKWAEKRNKNSYWLCKCDCGSEVITSLCHLRGGHTVSCGCRKKDIFKTHGKSYTPEYRLFISARYRAKRDGLDFDLDYNDIVIPTICPVFNTPFIVTETRGKGRAGILNLNSPSLDRLYPDKGYVKGNVWVISLKANLIKSSATPDEIRRVANAVDERIGL